MKSADFIEARRRLEARPKAVREKLASVEEAVGLVRDGDHIAMGGCLFSRPPVLLVREVLRQRRQRLTISRNLIGYEAELFMAAGAVETIVASWAGLGVPWGISKVLRHYVESGQVRYQEWSHLGIGLRYRAGAMGVPFLPMLSMVGSDLMRISEARTMECPFTGETVCLVPALFPDVAILHVHRADRLGNCQIDGYPHMDADMAGAAATVIVSADEIIDEEEVRRHPERTTIPGMVVDAVVEAPFGAFPGECYGLYDTYFAHFDEYAAGVQADGADGVRAYMDRFVYGPKSHQEYLGLFGPEVLEQQQRLGRELVGGL